MTELLSGLLNISVLAFAISSMLSVGCGYTLSQIVGPLRRARRVVRALVANFVLVPLLAIVILQFLPLERPLAVGLFLVATAAGAPFLIKLTQAAEADVALSATLLVLLLPVTIFYMPIIVPLALPEIAVSAAGIATPLVLTMLLPLALGLIVRAYAERLALRLQPIMGKLATIALVTLIASTILGNLREILGIFGTGAILAAVILIVGAFAIGFALGGRNTAAQEVLALGTGQRNISAATVVATQAVDNPETLSMVVVTSLVGFAVLFPLAGVLRRREPRATASH
jgi:BASS family bile acid:Na+ symporter